MYYVLHCYVCNQLMNLAPTRVRQSLPDQFSKGEVQLFLIKPRV